MLPLQKRTTHVAGSVDLTLVRGIGETTAARLKEAGVNSFERLSRTTPGELAALLGGTVRRSPARIAAERWTSQAAALAADARSYSEEGTARDEGRARHSFTLTLLIDVRSRQVIASKLVDCQTNDSVTIPGWNVGALIAYVRERAGLAEDTPANGTQAVPVLQGAQATPASPLGAATVRDTYPFAHGMKSLPRAQPGVVPHAIRVRVDPMRMSSALPKNSCAVVEFHALRQPASSTSLSRITVDLRPAEPVEIVMPIHLTPSGGPVDGRVVLWVIAPGLRPASMGAAIPLLEIDAEFLFHDRSSS
jgi:hypothetical protein